MTTPPFTPTLWPAEPPGQRLVPRYELSWSDGALRVGTRLEDVALPPDFAFQPWLRLDPNDIEAVVAFSHQWGLISPPGASMLRWYGDQSLNLRRLTARHGSIDDLVFPGVLSSIVTTGQALARHLVARREGASLATLADIWRPAGITGLEDIETADGFWRGFVNNGLAAYTVHLRLTDAADEPLGLVPTPLLYNAVCLELAGVATQGVRIYRCGNDRCDNQATVKRHKAKNVYRQHRSRGLVFCSDLCERAQSERDRRRRRADEKRATT